MSRDYLDFDLALTRDGPAYAVRVVSSPAGEASAPFVLPFAATELAQFMIAVGPPRVASRRLVPVAARVGGVKDYGRRLGDALLNGPVLDAFTASLDAAAAQDKDLRVRLRLDAVPELDPVPWEYVYDSRLERFLTLSQQTPVVRLLDSLQAATGRHRRVAAAGARHDLQPLRHARARRRPREAAAPRHDRRHGQERAARRDRARHRDPHRAAAGAARRLPRLPLHRPRRLRRRRPGGRARPREGRRHEPPRLRQPARHPAARRPQHAARRPQRLRGRPHLRPRRLLRASGRRSSARACPPSSPCRPRSPTAPPSSSATSSTGSSRRASASTPPCARSARRWPSPTRPPSGAPRSCSAPAPTSPSPSRRTSPAAASPETRLQSLYDAAQVRDQRRAPRRRRSRSSSRSRPRALTSATRPLLLDHVRPPLEEPSRVATVTDTTPTAGPPATHEDVSHLPPPQPPPPAPPDTEERNRPGGIRRS